MSPSSAARLTRRTLLKTLALAGAGAALPSPVFGQPRQTPPSDRAVLGYLASLARADGGYAWEDQEESHLTPTFAVIGCHRALGHPLPDPVRLAEFVRTHHPGRLKKLEQERRGFEFQQVQALVWLGADASELADKVRAWKQPLAYMKAYEQHGYPVFQSELGAFACRALLGLPLADLTPGFTDYLEARRRANGSFNNTPAADGGDGHVMNTWWGLRALQVLGRTREKQEPTVAWLRACQAPGGGFTFQPKPEFGGVEDAGYTWAAVRALQLLGAKPADPEGCAGFLFRLANGDGGFSDRPSWLSNPMATFYALEALEALGLLDSLATLRRRSARPAVVLPQDLKVFTIQIEAHGQGSPAEAVDLARGLRIHLWGAKNAQPEWIARAQLLADQQQVPVKFFAADEEYGTWVEAPGLGTYSHTSDIVAPAGSDFGAPLARQGVVSWPRFREQRLAPLVKAGGRLIWQFGENEELVRLYLDDSVERGGYAALSTFHFGNPDFTLSEPFLHRWRGQIPYIALQDSHGPEPWWFSDMTTGFRTLFLATAPTWDGWLKALEQNWVVAVRHDAWSKSKTWRHGGSREVLEFVRQRERDWRWWDNPEIQRPLVSLVALGPETPFEVARPAVGLALRVRCAWENTAQGLLKQPITELIRLTVDGQDVSPVLTATKALRGALLADHYYQFHWAQPEPGQHRASAVVRVVETKAEVSRTIQFTL